MFNTVIYINYKTYILASTLSKFFLNACGSWGLGELRGLRKLGELGELRELVLSKN
ncbi:MAG: hypothetical protein F6J96_28805 [Symploca sp. SIO1C2]|nr:hypothetical protein [Symploca sp. SIO1C2]